MLGKPFPCILSKPVIYPSMEFCRIILAIGANWFYPICILTNINQFFIALYQDYAVQMCYTEQGNLEL